ncbi:MAG: invasin domain 3-containing protein [Gemmatimonadota bacterium]
MSTSPRRLWAAAAVLLFLNACEDVSVTAVEVASVTVSPSQGTIFPGDTLRLSGMTRDASGTPLEGRAVTWTSQNGSVATVNGAGLVEAHSAGEAVIRASSGGGSGTATVTVRPRPELVFSLPEVSFGGAAGGGATEPVQILITSSDGGTLPQLSVEVAYPTGQTTGWLEASLQGSQSAAILSVRARPTSLPSGRYHAEIRVQSTQSASSPQSVAVTFEVGAAAPEIQLSASAIGFVWEEDQPAPSAQLVQIANAGGGELDGIAASIRYTAGQATGWLTARLDRTVAPAELTLRAAPGALSTGAFDAVVDISSDRATNSPQELRVRLTVGAPPPELDLDPVSLEWHILEGHVGDPPTRIVTVENRGSGTLGGLGASVSHPQGQPTGWLNASLGGGTAPTNLTLGLAAESLVPGIYRGTVVVVSPDAVNSPQAVTVELHVARGAAPELSEILVDPDTIIADGVSTSEITVLLRDQRGEPLLVGGHQVALNTTGGTLGSVTDEGNGTYTATLTSPKVVGTASITGTVDGDPIGGTTTVQFNPGPASPRTSTIEADPSSLIPDGTSTSTATIRLLDDQGNALTVGGDAVVLRLVGGGTIGGVIDQGDGTYVATYTAPTQSGTTRIEGEVNGEVMDDAATIVLLGRGEVSAERSEVVASPTSGVAADGVEASTVTVRLRDAIGNPFGGVARGDFTVDVSGSGSAGTVTETNESGTYRFSVTNTVVETVRVTVRALGVTLEDQPSITFQSASAPASRLAFGVQPSDTEAGATISPAVTVRIEDDDGNLVTSASTAVTIEIDDGPDEGRLSGTTTRNAVNGIATFNDLSIDRAGEEYTLEASAPGVSDVESREFDITGAAASELVFGVQPSDTEVGATISPAVTVRIEDDDGNVVTSASTAVTIEIDDNSSDGRLSGTTTRNAVNGIATFDNLSIDRAGDEYTLEASAPDLSDVESREFDITEASARRLVFGVQPSDTRAGATISPAVTVRIEEADGTLNSSSRRVTLSIAINPGNGRLSGTTTRNAVNGIATFDDLSIDRVGQGYTLGASGPGVPSTSSNSFDITEGSAARLESGSSR